MKGEVWHGGGVSLEIEGLYGNAVRACALCVLSYSILADSYKGQQVIKSEAMYTVLAVFQERGSQGHINAFRVVIVT